MASQFAVPSHTTYFAGYLDAVGRHYTTESRLCALTVAVMPCTLLDGLAIEVAMPVENMVREFAHDVSLFLNTDPRNRLVFYLTEYFSWYKHFSDSCICERLKLEGARRSQDSISYRLFVEHRHEVVFLGSWKDKGALAP
jgi:hypothetical protein